jgi:hypothetical protein
MFPETIRLDSSNDKVVSGSAVAFQLYSWPEDSLKGGANLEPTAGPLANETGQIFGICFNDDGDKIFGAVNDITGAADGGVARFDADDLSFEKVFRIKDT